MGEKNCLFQRPTFSQAHYLPDNLDCGLHVDEIFSVYAVYDDRVYYLRPFRSRNALEFYESENGT